CENADASFSSGAVQFQAPRGASRPFLGRSHGNANLCAEFWRNPMVRIRMALMVLGVLLSSAALAQTGPDPRENSFQFFVDGVLTQGVIGYRIEFNHDPVSRTDSRVLGT